MKLAIIGTAGRGEDADKLTLGHWGNMVQLAVLLSVRHGFRHFVSGGAAWADHVVIAICQQYPAEVSSLELHLPGTGVDVATAMRYHAKFSAVIGRETWGEVTGVYKLGLPFCNIVQRGGFKDRNTRVACRSTKFLAMTFGNGPQVKDGGTADTVRKMLAQGKSGWHLDLHDMTLHAVTA